MSSFIRNAILRILYVWSHWDLTSIFQSIPFPVRSEADLTHTILSLTTKNNSYAACFPSTLSLGPFPFSKAAKRKNIPGVAMASNAQLMGSLWLIRYSAMKKASMDSVEIAPPIPSDLQPTTSPIHESQKKAIRIIST